MNRAGTGNPEDRERAFEIQRKRIERELKESLRKDEETRFCTCDASAPGHHPNCQMYEETP